MYFVEVDGSNGGLLLLYHACMIWSRKGNGDVGRVAPCEMADSDGTQMNSGCFFGI